MYSLEVKEQALSLLKEYSVKEVATKIGVSIPTLYNWKKEYEKKVSKSISQMIVDLEYDKAIEVAKLFPKNKVIQSQLITVYIKQGEYEKVIEIAKRFPKCESIQSQLITIYIKQGEYEKGIETAELFLNYDPDSEVIQSQLITIYIKQGEYEKGIELASRFPNFEVIQSQLMTIYIKQGKHKEGIELASRFPNFEVIQSQLMTIYIKQGKHKEGIELASRFPNYEFIQNQLMTIYIKQGKYKEGIELASRFPNYEFIQNQLMTIYIKQGKYKEGIELASRFPKNEFIQNKLSMITYSKYDRCNKEQSKELEYQNTPNTENRELIKKLNNIRSKILLGTVQLEDVEYLDSFKDEIDLERYLLIKAAIYERLNFKNNCVAIIKQIPNIDIRQKRKLIEEVLKKQKYYNIQKWDELIKWEIDDMESYLENKNQIVEIEQKRTRKLVLPVEKSTEKQNHSEKTKIISGTMTRSNSKNNKNVKPKKEKETTIYECLNSDYKLAVSELKLKYYLEMYDEHHKKDGILKYDRLETVLNSDSSNTLAFRQLLLMLMDASYDFSNDYPTEYQEIKNKVLTKTLSTKKG